MKRSIITSLLALAALAMVAFAPSAQGQCSNLTTKGTYGVTASGSLGGLPLALVGTVTNDGLGNVTSTYTLTVNGTTTTGLHAEGTYNVRTDCTGSVTDNTNNAHYELVVLRHGAEMFVINTDPGNTFTVDFRGNRNEAARRAFGLPHHLSSCQGECQGTTSRLAVRRSQNCAVER